jgi:hypothetical protein
MLNFIYVVSIMLSVSNLPIVLNVVMLNVIMLNVVMLNVVMLNVVMLSVVAPFQCTNNTPNKEGPLWAKGGRAVDKRIN